MPQLSDLPTDIVSNLHSGQVIPAHPLALGADRTLDERRQRALTRYYLDAGAGGLAIGVHTTQFAIRDVGLYEPVLRLGAETVADWSDHPVAMIAGLAGRTDQAIAEASVAARLGYHAGLLSLGSFSGASEDELIDHCKSVASVMPLFGFYLQPAAGGIDLSSTFWERFASIENVVAIKIAPFNRYRTLDVIRGVVNAGAENRIALYTGNDDHIVLDLLCSYSVIRDGNPVTVRIVGGLLGHWSVWTKAAVGVFHRARKAATAPKIRSDLLALDAMITDCNGALFDAANNYGGAIAGCHEVLRRQGLLEGIWCIDPGEGLGPGQADEITRVQCDYPHLTDDEFVRKNLERWLA